MTVRIEGDLARYMMGRMLYFERKDPTIQAVQINEPFIVVQDADTAGVRGEVTAEAGSWLVYNEATQALYPVPDESFKKLYRAR